MQKLIIAIAALLLVPALMAQSPNATPQFQVTKASLENTVKNSAAYQPFLPYVKHGIEAFKITYSTQYKEKDILVSGTLCIPDKAGPKPLLVFNHGTTFQSGLIPSNWANGVRIEVLWATNGYITLIPDYIGYGVNTEELHPYMVKEHEAQTVIDMIGATKSILNEKKVAQSGQLFVSGFSQGGHVTLSLLEKLGKSKEVHGFNITATAAIGAPTRICQNLRHILEQDTFNSIGYVGAVMASYNEQYWKRPYTDFFQEPYASLVASYAAGNTDMQDMVNGLSKNIAELMNPDFLTAFKAKGEKRLKKDLKRNDTGDLKLTAPLMIVHGTNDGDVPYELMLETLESLKRKSGNEQLIRFETLEGANHNLSGQLGLMKVLDFFDSLVKQ